MKKTINVQLVRVLGIIALIAVIGFSMAACDDGGGDDGGGGSTGSNNGSNTGDNTDGDNGDNGDNNGDNGDNNGDNGDNGDNNGDNGDNNGDNGGTQPTFFWGNYIPETISTAGNLVGASMTSIQMDELISTVSNQRVKKQLPAGVPTNQRQVIFNQDGSIYGIYDNNGIKQVDTTTSKTPGATLWEENKFSEPASKLIGSANAKIEYINPTLGYPFFVYPAEYGKVTILDGAGANITDISFTHYNDILIEGVNYNAARITNPFTSNSNIEFRFHW